MDLKNQQTIFDDIKWYDSILSGYDRCGSYAFCSVCDKAESEPCARAAYRYQHPDEELLDDASNEIAEPDTSRLIRIAVVRLKKK